VIVYRVFALRQYNYNIEERGSARRDSEINAVTDPARSRWHSIAYWVTTALVVFELALGGVWDILRVPQVRGLIEYRSNPEVARHHVSKILSCGLGPLVHFRGQLTRDQGGGMADGGPRTQV
jgi:hypothetical protein